MVSHYRDLPLTNQPKLQLLRHARSCLVSFLQVRNLKKYF